MSRTRHEDADAYIADQPGELTAILADARALILDEASGAREAIKWGHPTYSRGGNVCYLSAFTEHVNLGFFRGTELADPKGLLEGTGQSLRHVKLRPNEVPPAEDLRALVREAFELGG